MSLHRILSSTAYVAAVASTDAYGKPIYGTPVARSVRVEESRRMVRNAQGEETVSSHRLWCLEAISITDRIWLPGTSTSSAEASRLPISVSASSDFVGSRTLYRVDL